MPTDFRDGKSFPRRGRLPLGKTICEYISPSPIDRGVMERWGITPEQFDGVISQNRDDESILQWAESSIGPEAIDAANSWVCGEKFENLDRQDREEGAFDAALVRC